METKNLLIRDSEFADCKLFAEWESKPDVTAFFTMDDDRDYEYVVREYVDCDQQDKFLQMTIILKHSNIPIGRLVVSNINYRNDSLKIARIYIAEQEYRNKGYAKEALKAVLEYIFINMHMERVSVTVFPEDKIGKALCNSLGFVEEGILRNSGKKNGRYFDLCEKSMLRSEYLMGNRNIG